MTGRGGQAGGQGDGPFVIRSVPVAHIEKGDILMGDVLFIGFFVLALAIPFIAFIQEAVMLIVSVGIISPDSRPGKWVSKSPRLEKRYRRYSKYGWAIELILYLLCFLYENVFLDLLYEVVWRADWQEQLYNSQLHQPISSNHFAGVIVVVAFFFLGIAFLGITDSNKVPPLLTCVAIGSLYIGSFYSIMWTLHISVQLDVRKAAFFVLFLPVNTILISSRYIVQKTYEYSIEPGRSSKIDESVVLSRISQFRNKALYLPVVGFLCVIPIIGIMALILILFGQAPDAAIKAFTETSQFGFSTKVSPQNLNMDAHYLCTVAAGGHKKVVKPLRMGRRHGHAVIVNRQLQVANAFEEVLIDYTPRFHKVVRHIYDTYGFPIAKLIKKQWVADVVYFIMKPLEWIFLVVLYATCVHPEDRIALQYTK